MRKNIRFKEASLTYAYERKGEGRRDTERKDEAVKVGERQREV